MEQSKRVAFGRWAGKLDRDFFSTRLGELSKKYEWFINAVKVVTHWRCDKGTLSMPTLEQMSSFLRDADDRTRFGRWIAKSLIAALLNGINHATNRADRTAPFHPTLCIVDYSPESYALRIALLNPTQVGNWREELEPIQGTPMVLRHFCDSLSALDAHNIRIRANARMGLLQETGLPFLEIQDDELSLIGLDRDDVVFKTFVELTTPSAHVFWKK